MPQFLLSTLFLLSFLYPHSLRAENQKPLTLDDVNRVNFSGTVLSALTWLDSEHFLQRKKEVLLKVNAVSGAAVPFYDAAKMEAAFAKISGFDVKSAKAVAGHSDLMSPDRTAVVIYRKDNIYHYSYGADSATQLAGPLSGIDNLSFSPDGKQLAFVRNNNIHRLDIASHAIQALTSDGNAKLFNGILDWVYQEEVYGRGDFKSYWWSPDSKRIAFLQLDETLVKQFLVVDHMSPYQNIETVDYPKAGTPNPKVRLGIIELCCNKLTWVNLEKYQSEEPIIARVGWNPDSTKVIYYISNREQTWMDINAADVCTAQSATLFRETTGAWVEADRMELPLWLSDGSFLFLSERNGWKHIYHFTATGTLLRQITSGNWEVRKLHGIDASNTYLYFSGTERSHIGSDTYRIKLDGSELKRMTTAEGTHRTSFNPGLTAYVDTWSDASTPPQTRLHNANGSLVRVLEENKVAVLNQYRLSKPEFLQVKTRDGFLMEAMLIKPPDFNPAKKYPVWSHTYSGPHAPSVHNSWGGSQHMWHQYLAQKGIMVWVCDNRSASGKGAESAWTSHKQLGVQELADLEDGVSYLKSLPYVDGARIGISGWSFGGFMTAYAMTHSKSFKLGIAGALVTDWNLYDTIYTERYMLTPQHNPEGYAKTSVLKAAKNLSGKLMLIHGTMDDNVHLQNTIQLIYEFQKSGKQFDLMLYPKSRHGVGSTEQNRHLREMMTNYILNNL